jgi:hypothetical protein
VDGSGCRHPPFAAASGARFLRVRITARIRRRQEAHTATGQAVQGDGEGGAAEALPPAPADSPGKPTTTFQERIAMERQNKDREPSLP